MIAAVCVVTGQAVYWATGDSGPATAKAAARKPAKAVEARPEEPKSASARAHGSLEGPVQGIEIVSVDDDIRFTPTSRPTNPSPQRPPLANERNVDTGKPVHEWQRMTDDWFGLRPKLDDRGISFAASFTGDLGKNLRGGLDTNHSSARYLLNANLTLDTERLMGWQGGTFFIGVQDHRGDDGTEAAGSLQAISNIDAPSYTTIAELWFEQLLLNDKLRLKVGKVDANSEFAHAEYSDNFLNGAFGALPSIVGLPTYPDPAMSVNVFVNPNEHVYVGLGVYDGSTALGKSTGTRGPSGFFDGEAYFIVGEAGVTWAGNGRRNGRIAGGVWHHTADFEQFDGGSQKGTTGPYVVLNQTLWRELPDEADDEQGMGVFAQFGWSDPQISEVRTAFALGMAWTGSIPGRDDDVLGLGVARAGLSNQAGFEDTTETAFELFYRVRINAWLSVTPDLQYVSNPAGAGDNVVVGTVRLTADF